MSPELPEFSDLGRLRRPRVDPQSDKTSRRSLSEDVLPSASKAVGTSAPDHAAIGPLPSEAGADAGSDGAAVTGAVRAGAAVVATVSTSGDAPEPRGSESINAQGETTVAVDGAISRADHAWWDREVIERIEDLVDGSRARLGIAVAAVAVLVLGVWWLVRPTEVSPVPAELVPLAGDVASEVADPTEPDDTLASSDSTDGADEPGDVSAPELSDELASGGAGVGAEGSSVVAETVVVHLAGAVASPGVYELDAGSRVIDAVTVAGGPSAGADLARVNLAALVVDGSRLYLPAVGEDEVPPVVAATTDRTVAGADDNVAESRPPVDINSASLAELQQLPGVGPTIAAAMIETRETLGGFPNVDALLEVPGIGEAKLNLLRNAVMLTP